MKEFEEFIKYMIIFKDEPENDKTVFEGSGTQLPPAVWKTPTAKLKPVSHMYNHVHSYYSHGFWPETLTLAKMDTIQRPLTRGAEWCKFQLHSTFQ